MVVVANWLMWCQGCLREMFWALGLQLFLLYTAELSSLMERKLDSYADDSTLVADVQSPGERVAVSKSMNLDLNRAIVCGVTCGE